MAPATTRDQMKTLFGYLGRIDDLVIYPESESTTMPTKVVYVKFYEAEDVGVALHLTNTVFIDRALIIVPVPDGKIPDEKTALSAPTGQYPVLPASTELAKVDEIRRTVYIANIDASVSPESMIEYFGKQAGEVKFARMAGDEGSAVRAAYIEFTDQVSVVRALALSGQLLGSRPMSVVPANTAIVKPTMELPGVATDGKGDAESDTNGRRSRSKSHSRRKSRSRSHGSRSTRSHRSRSHRSRSRHRSGSRSHRSRRRSSSKSPKRKSPSPAKRRRSRSRSRDQRAGRFPRISPGRRDRDRKSKSKSPSKTSDRDSRRSGRGDDSSRGRRDGSRRSPKRSPTEDKKSHSRSRSPPAKKERSRHGDSGRDRDRKRESDGAKKERDSTSRRHDRDPDERKERGEHKSRHRHDREDGRASKVAQEDEERSGPEDERSEGNQSETEIGRAHV